MKMKCLFTLILTFVAFTICCKKNQSENQNQKISQIDYSTLQTTEKLSLLYATEFSVEKKGDYKLIKIKNDREYLLIPQNKQLPINIPKNIVILKQPFDKTYIVSTSVMDFISKIGASKMMKFSGTKDWFIKDAIEMMKNNELAYAGKYSAPDFELLLSQGCNFAIYNTMIYHKPQIKEKIEELGIQVFIERSTYEQNPLGRLEWIKLYGILFNKENEANQFFDEQIAKIESVINKNKQESQQNKKKIAFFSVTSNGNINVRKPNDYIAKMINISGAKYALDDKIIEEESAFSTMNMQIEDFYVCAVDCDIIIYNSTIEGKIYSIEELLQKNAMFNDFYAVKNKKVYCTEKNFFQETTGFASFIEDLSKIIDYDNNNDDNENLTYLYKLK